MFRFLLMSVVLFSLAGCASQEDKTQTSGETTQVAMAQANQKGPSTSVQKQEPLFDPGPFHPGDNESNEPAVCPGEVESFTWNSGQLDASAINRQIITVNGYMEYDGMRLEVSWSRHKVQRHWSGFEQNDSFENWKSWLKQPVSEVGASLSGSMKSKLTLIHRDNCQRSGVPTQTEAWTRLNAWVLSQVEDSDSVSKPPSSIDGGNVESSSNAVDVSVREQVVFALEQASDIKSVRLVCENQWEDRIGVRNGRARFENVPAVECQVGWIGERKGWFKIPAEWSLVQCVFETDSFDCQAL